MPAPLCLAIVIATAAFPGACRAQSASPPQIVINELHYQPPNRTKREEFIELHNPSPTAVNLAGWRLADGVEFAFPFGTSLSGGGYIVVAADSASFRARFGFTPLGPWNGRLSNRGERLELRDNHSRLVDEVNYGVGFPWPTDPAGGGALATTGFSAELIHPSLDRNLGGSWRSSLPPGVAPATTYVSARDPAWRYRKGTSEASSPPSAWRLPDFAEDETWLTGQTSIGFGDIDDQTILGDMFGNYVSVCLRHAFIVPPGQIPGALRLRLRVDDGCIVWINGLEVARAHMNPGEFAFDAEHAAQNHEASPTIFEEFPLPNAAASLREGSNVLAIQVFNLTFRNGDLTFDAELSAAQGTASPTPGRRNSVLATNAPPAIRQVAHSPAEPRTGDPVLVTAKITDPQGVKAVTLSYQVVRPGSYVRKSDAAYTNSANWVSVPMNDAGVDGDAVAADSLFSATLPASLQVHRRLIRYRIQASDGGSPAVDVTVPYADDGSPNFAYFVYDGVPAWQGARKPTAPNRTPLLHFPESVMGALPPYHLIADGNDVINSQYNPGYDGVTMQGTLIIDSQVYDHVEYHIRGRNSTYVSGKNKWRFRANRTRPFQMRDDYGRP